MPKKRTAKQTIAHMAEIAADTAATLVQMPQTKQWVVKRLSYMIDEAIEKLGPNYPYEPQSYVEAIEATKKPAWDYLKAMRNKTPFKRYEE